MCGASSTKVLPDGGIQDQGFRIQAFKFLGGQVAGQIIAMAATRTIVTTLTLLAALSAAAANPQVEIKTTLGAVVIELYGDRAPLTVDNFLHYVKDQIGRASCRERVCQYV